MTYFLVKDKKLYFLKKEKNLSGQTFKTELTKLKYKSY